MNADKIADEKVYPQASSFDLATHAPTRLLKRRIEVYEKELLFSKWTPESIIDIGTGKGFFLRFWPSVKRSQAVEFLEELDIPEGCRLFKTTFLGAVGMEPADLMLALRVPHYLFAESLSPLYMLKAAMLCKDRLLWESRPAAPEVRAIKGRWEQAIAKVPWIKRRGTSKAFLDLASRFFTLERRFVATFKEYDTLSFRRIMPPIVKTTETAHRTERKGDRWEKAGYTESQVMQHWSILQALGISEVVEAFLEGPDGRLCGEIQRHVEGPPSSREKCQAMFVWLYGRLMPISYIPVDIVPKNLINGVPVDISCAMPVELRLSQSDKADPMFRSALMDQIRQIEPVDVGSIPL